MSDPSEILGAAGDDTAGLQFTHRVPNIIAGAGTDQEFIGQKYTLITVKERRKSAGLTRKGIIVLPLPVVLSDPYNVEYNDVELGAIGSAMVGSGTGIAQQGFVEGMKLALDNGMKSLNLEATKQVGKEMALSAIPLISSDAARAIVTTSSGKTMNPYMTTTFKGIGFRQHSLEFRIIPQNETESESLQNIVTQFKKSMLPEDVFLSDVPNTPINPGTKNFNTGVQKIPDFFDIKFYAYTKNYSVDGSKHLFNIREAALTSFNVSYENDNGPQFFKGGAPFSVTMQCSFTESKLYTKQRHLRERRIAN